MLKLYDYFRSSASFRVRIALNLKKLNYEAVPIHLVNEGGEQFSSQYQRINPQSLVPALEDQNNIVTQSLAIIEYLEDKHPTPALLPQDPLQKARVRAFALTIAADIHPLNNLRVLKYLTSEFAMTEEQKTKWYYNWLEKGLSALEKQVLAQGGSSPFCFGTTPSLADICLVPQLYNAKRFNFDLTPYPTLRRIDETCLKHDAFIQALPLETVN